MKKRNTSCCRVGKKQLAFVVSLSFATTFTGLLTPLAEAKQQTSISEAVSFSDQYLLAQTETEPLPSANAWRNPQLIHTLEGHTAAVDALSFTPDGKMLISGGSTNDGTIKLWWLKTGREIDSFRGHRTSVLSLLLSSDGETLASAGDDAAINLWNWKTGEYTRTFLGHSSNVLCLAMTSDGQTLVSGGLDGIRLWDLRRQRPLYNLARFDNQTYALAVHPEGNNMVSGLRDGSLKRWNLKTGQLLQTIPAHSDAVSTLLFSQDGKTMVSGSYDRTIRIWNLTTGQIDHTLSGHTGRIRSIALNPNGETLASASRDGVRLWNLKTGELIAVLKEHEDWVQSVSFSRDGRLLATGGFDQKIRIWQVD